MIAYEIQLWYVIRDKLCPRQNAVRDKMQSETKCSPRQNSVRDKVQEFFIYQKNNFVGKKILGYFLSD